MIALTCPWCGAPLPPLAATANAVQCGYCGALAGLTGGKPVKAEAATAVPVEKPNLSNLMTETFDQALKNGLTPFDAVREAARAHLGAMGQTDTFARVVLGLAYELDAQNGTTAARDPVAMGRLMSVYLRAMNELRRSDSTEINLPFFTVNASGAPVHFDRRLTADVIADLARSEPRAPAPPPPPPPAPEPEPPQKKKGWFW